MKVGGAAGEQVTAELSPPPIREPSGVGGAAAALASLSGCLAPSYCFAEQKWTRRVNISVPGNERKMTELDLQVNYWQMVTGSWSPHSCVQK